MKVAGSLDVSESLKKEIPEEPEPVKEIVDTGVENWMLHILLFIALITGFIVMMQPAYLGGLEGRVYDTYWENIHEEIQNKILVQYEQLPNIEKAKLIQQEFIEAKEDPQNIRAYETELEKIKSIYRNEQGILYPYSGHGILKEAKEGSSTYGKFLGLISVGMRIVTPNFEKGLSYYPILLGLLGIILVYIIAWRINKYSAPIAAFTLAMQPTYFSELHYGNIGFNWNLALVGLGISLVMAYVFHKILPRLAKLVGGLQFGITRLRFGAVILVIVLIGTIYVDEAWSMREETPKMDDSIVAAARHLSLRPQGKTLMWNWEDVYNYYGGVEGTGLSEAEIGKVFLTEEPESDYVMVSEDYIGKSTAMAQAAGIDNNVSVSSISQCMEVQDMIACGGNFIVKDGEVTQKGKHPKAFYNYIEGEVIQYEDSVKDYAFVLYEDEEIYSFLVEEQYANSLLFRMLARDKIEGYNKTYSTTFPRQIVIYEKLSED